MNMKLGFIILMAKNKTLLAALLLSSLLGIFFFDVLFLGKTYLSADAQSARSLTFAAENDAMFPQHFPYIFSGMPSIMVYTSPYLYFPNILTTWLPTYNALYVGHVLHYLLAGMGMFLLLRSYGFWAGIVGAVSFIFTTNMLGQEIYGHGGLMMTAAYIPLIMWALNECFFDKGFKSWGILALLLGLQMQRGHYQVIYYTWLLVGAFFVYHRWRFKSFNLTAYWGLNGKFIFSLIGCGILAIGMAAMTILPTIEYAEHSIRNNIDFTYASSWSFHPKELITLILPNFYGFGDATYIGFLPFTHFPNYLGISVLILACFARGKIVRYFIGVILVSLFISFGKYTPIYEFLYNYMPFFDKFRAPMMILILVQFSVAVLAGMGLSRVLQIVKNSVFNRTRLIISENKLLTVSVLAILVLISDLWFVGYKINKTHDLVDLRQKDEIVKFFEKNPGQYRVAFIPPLNKNNEYAAHGIESVGGYHAAKLKIYQKFLQKPPSLQSLGILNTAFIVSDQRLDVDLPVASMADGAYIYVNTQALPRYFLTEKGGKIQVLDKQIEYAKLGVSLSSPQRIILSEIYYPAWKIYVNGKKAKNEIWRNLLCSVKLEAGEHLVELKYKSTYFNIGAVICFLSVGVIGFLIIKRRK